MIYIRTCSVIKMDKFLYFLLIFVPSVINLKINIPSEKLQNKASILQWECNVSRSCNMRYLHISLILHNFFK